MNHWVTGWMMGKYAGFVGTAYGLAVAILIMHCFRISRLRRKVRFSLLQWLKR
jgi:heme exporter protein CcmD